MLDSQEIEYYTAKLLHAVIALAFFLFVLTAVGFFALGRYTAPPTNHQSPSPATALPAPPEEEE